jgi:uncharacterized protein
MPEKIKMFRKEGFAMRNFQEAVLNRRTNYALKDDVSIAPERITAMIESMTQAAPSAFNMQSSRVVVLFGEQHEKLWYIVKKTLRKVVAPETFSLTEEKVDGFAKAYGTILYFDDMSIVEEMAKKYPTYKDNFPVWAQQANGMVQFAIWTALADYGLGANLQHYNPLIDAEVKNSFGLPAKWSLVAQMPFGSPAAMPEAIEKVPAEQRVNSFG